MTGEPIRPEPTISLARLSKEIPMPDHSDPANSSVKPGLSSSEGKTAALVVLVATLGPVVTALAGVMPDNQYVQIAVIVVSAVTSILVTLGIMKKRSDVKETANAGAVALALADKAIAVAKENPDLAREILKSAGISVPK